jgi:hypothetical protein
VLASVVLWWWGVVVVGAGVDVRLGFSDGGFGAGVGDFVVVAVVAVVDVGPGVGCCWELRWAGRGAFAQGEPDEGVEDKGYC